jgi:hypothetical protein
MNVTETTTEGLRRQLKVVIGAEELEQRYRIPSLHSTTMHDSDSRVGAYYRSEATVKAKIGRASCRERV